MLQRAGQNEPIWHEAKELNRERLWWRHDVIDYDLDSETRLILAHQHQQRREAQRATFYIAFAALAIAFGAGILLALRL